MASERHPKRAAEPVSEDTASSHDQTKKQKPHFPAEHAAAVAHSTAVTESVFGVTPEGKEVKAFTLTNRNGLSVKLIELGAIITEVHIPDKNGTLADIVLGFDTLEPYLTNKPHFGAICGRFANRIGGAKFSLDGVEYKFEPNNGANLLHGGAKGFNKQVFNGFPVVADEPTVQFHYTSPDGDSGFPGALDLKITYLLSDDNALCIKMTATTSAPTVCNLASHSYWNLAGHETGDVLKQVVQINGDSYTPNDEGQIPTGEIASVKGTPLDFLSAKPIGQDIAKLHDDKKTGGGYDHNFVLRKLDPEEKLSTRSPFSIAELNFAARASDPESGRVLELFTNQPGVQLYTGNWLDPAYVGKGAHPYGKYHGFCLETQIYPDAPNKPNFPSATLRPGETYEHVMVHRFSVAK